MMPKVELKGIREGLLVTLGDGNWADVEMALMLEIEKKPEFFTGAKIILDVENHIISAAELGKLRDRLSDNEISLWAVLSNSPKTEQNAQVLGMATQIHTKQTLEGKRSYDELSELGGDEGILIRKTLWSGNSIEYQGHVTIIGDVNPGAEVVASGDVVVWGRLRGLVHAGAEGDDAAVVCALDLSPTQLRIADKIAVPPDDDGEPKPEIALIREGQVVAEVWKI